MIAACTTIAAQPRQEEYLGLPGDNLNLYAVMKLFQESETIEGFERNLNDENSRINNLDLNGDNYIDYIKVADFVDRDVHNIVLQVAVNKYENQDVAVFTVQRLSGGQVQVQLIGDEDLYGRNYIIEPISNEQYAGETPNPGYAGNVTTVSTNYYAVAAWPVVRFLYTPNYIVWHSDWHWGYYPSYWHAWRPYSWHYYYGYHYNWYDNYYSNYHHCHEPRYNHWDDFYYTSRRSHSQYVSHNIESGHYKDTYSHPDQRSHGEELYRNTTHNESTRRAAPSQGNSNERRADTQTNYSKSPAESSTATTRRTNTATTRPTATSERSATTSVRDYNSFSEHRAAMQKSDRPATGSRPATTTAKSTSTSKQGTTGESFSSRRNSTNSKPAKTPEKSSEKKNSTEQAKQGRR